MDHGQLCSDGSAAEFFSAHVSLCSTDAYRGVVDKFKFATLRQRWDVDGA